MLRMSIVRSVATIQNIQIFSMSTKKVALVPRTVLNAPAKAPGTVPNKIITPAKKAPIIPVKPPIIPRNTVLVPKRPTVPPTRAIAAKTPLVSASGVWISLCPVESTKVPKPFIPKAAEVMKRLNGQISSATPGERGILFRLQQKGPGFATLGDAAGVPNVTFRILAEIRGIAMTIGAVKVAALIPKSTVRGTTVRTANGELKMMVGQPLVYDALDLCAIAEEKIIPRQVVPEGEIMNAAGRENEE